VNLTIGPLSLADLDQADRVFRIAFGTRNGLANPLQFDGDAARIRTRCLSAHVLGLGAWNNGTLVASSLGTAWGTFGWIGPLSVHPEYWNEGIGQRLLAPTIESLEQRDCRHLALFTLGESPKHVSLYHKFGFWPGSLILVGQKAHPDRRKQDYRTYEQSTGSERNDFVDSCKELTSSIYGGLDLSQEIYELHRQALGDTILVLENGRVDGFAICHTGAGTEAGSEATQVKFAAVRPGALAPSTFERLLDACEDMASEKGSKRLMAGINTARRSVYSAMINRGFKTVQQGVAMHRPDETAYDCQDSYVIDDWR
jgi:N-acetylglutamate synthase-like GNAT family acetyltransferase